MQTLGVAPHFRAPANRSSFPETFFAAAALLIMVTRIRVLERCLPRPFEILCKNLSFLGGSARPLLD